MVGMVAVGVQVVRVGGSSLWSVVVVDAVVVGSAVLEFVEAGLRRVPVPIGAGDQSTRKSRSFREGCRMGSDLGWQPVRAADRRVTFRVTFRVTIGVTIRVTFRVSCRAVAEGGVGGPGRGGRRAPGGRRRGGGDGAKAEPGAGQGLESGTFGVLAECGRNVAAGQGGFWGGFQASLCSRIGPGARRPGARRPGSSPRCSVRRPFCRAVLRGVFPPTRGGSAGHPHCGVEGVFVRSRVPCHRSEAEA